MVIGAPAAAGRETKQENSPMQTHEPSSAPSDVRAWYLVGIDDTDNLQSRGTGYRARCLGERIATAGLGRVHGISRHQLLVSPDIPYTSHNSSACLRVESSASAQAPLIELCRDFLLSDSAPGSDAGLCVAAPEQAAETVRGFGRRAQREVLHRDEAVELAEKGNIHLEGLTGDHGGMIGALAAVGLRAAGEDGRFVWVSGIREHAGGRFSLEKLLQVTGVERVETMDGRLIDDMSETVDLGPWPRPIVRGGRAVLLVDDKVCNWRVVDRAVIKQY
jgi:hypothetical protein